MELRCLATSAGRLDSARRLEAVAAAVSSVDGLVLEVGEARTVLRDGGGRTLQADFATAALRRRAFGRERELVERAVRGRRGESPFVLDATAGLGRDAFVLAARGCHVLLVERSPLVHALLEDGLRRLGDWRPDVGARLQLLNADAADLMADWPARRPRPQVVYLDPMYPQPASRKALPAGDLQLLQKVVADDGGDGDGDTARLLSVGLGCSGRVVLKRPRLAADIARPNHRLLGRAARFDVFVAASREV